MKKILLGLSLVALSVPVWSGAAALAQDFKKGWDAYEEDDYATALNELLPLAKEGDSEAQYLVGTIFQDGNGVPQDFSEAAEWYLLAAEQNYASAQFNLGAMYYLGNGVPQDYEAAFKWFRLSAKSGIASAQSALGLLYRFGDAVPQDNIRSHMWYNIASANGDTDAGSFRDKIADNMTSADISKAQEMARECMNSDYENCGW